jgi:hypothetical protein
MGSLENTVWKFSRIAFLWRVAFLISISTLVGCVATGALEPDIFEQFYHMESYWSIIIKYATLVPDHASPRWQTQRLPLCVLSLSTQYDTVLFHCAEELGMNCSGDNDSCLACRCSGYYRISFAPPYDFSVVLGWWDQSYVSWSSVRSATIMDSVILGRVCLPDRVSRSMDT